MKGLVCLIKFTSGLFPLIDSQKAGCLSNPAIKLHQTSHIPMKMFLRTFVIVFGFVPLLRTIAQICPQNYDSFAPDLCFVHSTQSQDKDCEFLDTAPITEYLATLFPSKVRTAFLPVRLQQSLSYYMWTEKDIHYGKALHSNQGIHDKRDDCVHYTPGSPEPLQIDSCQSAIPESLCVYKEQTTTFCEEFDQICESPPEDNCHCLSPHVTKFFCSWRCPKYPLNKAKCSRCQEKFENYGPPTITLSTKSSRLFILLTNPLKLKTLINGRPIVCWSDYFDAYLPWEEPFKWQSLTLNKINDFTYEFSTADLHESAYWCTGFQLPDLTPVTSNKLVFPHNKFDFVFVINSTINTFPYYILSPHTQVTVPIQIGLGLVPKTRSVSISPENENQILSVNHIAGAFDYDYPDLLATYAHLKDKITQGNRIYLSKDFCLPDSYSHSEELPSRDLTAPWEETPYWDITPVGTKAFPEQMCLTSENTLSARECSGNYYTGAYWGEAPPCAKSPQGLTQILIDLLKSNLTIWDLNEALLVIVSENKHVLPHDVFLMAEIMKKISHSPEEYKFQTFAQTLSRIMDLDPTTLEASQLSLNSTDTIIYSLDVALKHSREPLQLHLSNVALSKAPLEEDVSGVAFYQSETYEKLVMLHGETFLDLDKRDLQFMAAFPGNLIEQILNETETSYLVVAIFKKDTLFNEKSRRKLRTYIPSFFATGFDLPLFHAPVRIYIRPFRKYRSRKRCSFWRYGTDDLQTSIKGFWSEEATSSSAGDFWVCDFRHMTHFAILLDMVSNDTLDLLSALGSGLSLAGVLGVLLTAAFFESWRSEIGSKILLNFCCVVAAQMVLLYVANGIDSYAQETACVYVGVLLHYSVISQFFWMLFISYLQYRRFVVVLPGSTKRFLLLACVIGWLLPALPVVITVFFTRKSYVQDEYCFLTGAGLNYGVTLPVSVIILGNVVMFGRICASFMCREAEGFSSKKSELMLVLRLYFLLFFLMGFTWIFGLLNGFLQVLSLSYMFCVSSSLQGFVVFLFYVVLNENTRNLWSRWCINVCKRGSW